MKYDNRSCSINFSCGNEATTTVTPVGTRSVLASGFWTVWQRANGQVNTLINVWNKKLLELIRKVIGTQVLVSFYLKTKPSKVQNYMGQDKTLKRAGLPGSRQNPQMCRVTWVKTKPLRFRVTQVKTKPSKVQGYLGQDKTLKGAKLPGLSQNPQRSQGCLFQDKPLKGTGLPGSRQNPQRCRATRVNTKPSKVTGLSGSRKNPQTSQPGCLGQDKTLKRHRVSWVVRSWLLNRIQHSRF